MKVRVMGAVLVAIAASSSAPASAQNLTGTWNIESETQRGTQNITLTLAQDGTELTGTVTMSFGGRRGGGGGGAGAQEIAIEDGTVEGQAFSFTYSFSFGGNSITFEMSGTYEGNLMEGTIEGGRGGGRPFSGERGG